MRLIQIFNEIWNETGKLLLPLLSLLLPLLLRSSCECLSHSIFIVIAPDLNGRGSGMWESFQCEIEFRERSFVGKRHL